MTNNQNLAVQIAESLLDALPTRYGAHLERLFVANASLIIIDILNSKSMQSENLQVNEVTAPENDA